MDKTSLFIWLFVSTFIWEHISRMSDYVLRPTYFIDIFAEYLRQFYTLLGKLIATISSFFVWLEIEEIVVTLQIYIESLLSLLTSAAYVIEGYVTKVSEYANIGLVNLGCLTLTVLIAAFGPYLYVRYKKWRQV